MSSVYCIISITNFILKNKYIYGSQIRNGLSLDPTHSGNYSSTNMLAVILLVRIVLRMID